MTTMGKFRHLSRCCTPGGHFVVLAIDHRDNLLEALNRHTPLPFTDEAFVGFKQLLIQELAPLGSAVLTDPAYGIGYGISSGAISGRIGLLAPIEVTDYRLQPSQRSIRLIPGWSVEKIKRVGGDGVKLLLPYHPKADSTAEKIELVKRIVDECNRYDIPFFLEPIAYSLNPGEMLPNAELLDTLVEIASCFSSLRVDVLKLQFPIDTTQTPDPAEWRAACRTLNAACKVPWVLLSGGIDYDTFLKQTEIACESGASGVIVGRAVWSEAVALQPDQRTVFIKTTAHERMNTLADSCLRHGNSIYNQITAPQPSTDWYM